MLDILLMFVAALLVIPFIACIILSTMKNITRQELFVVCATVSYIANFLAVTESPAPLPMDQILAATLISGTLTFALSYIINSNVFRKRINRSEKIASE